MPGRPSDERCKQPQSSQTVERSTGPKTPAGKAKVARNADKGGEWRLLRELAKLLRESANLSALGSTRCDADGKNRPGSGPSTDVQAP